MLHCIIIAAALFGLCVQEDFFNDGSISSSWTVVSDDSGAVSVTEQASPDAGLFFNFATLAPSEDPAVAGVLSNGWSVDLAQDGVIQIRFQDISWPTAAGDSIGLGMLLFEGFDAEDDPNVTLEIQGGVREGVDYMVATGGEGEGDPVSAEDLEHFTGTVWIWWTVDVGIWYGFSPMYVVDGGPWDEAFPEGTPGLQDLGLYGTNEGCTSTFDLQAGFEYMCYRTDTAGMPELCPADVVPTYDINAADLAAVLDMYAQTCTDCREDVNHDGHVNMLDLIDVLIRWGDCLNPAS